MRYLIAGTIALLIVAILGNLAFTLAGQRQATVLPRAASDGAGLGSLVLRSSGGRGGRGDGRRRGN